MRKRGSRPQQRQSSGSSRQQQQGGSQNQFHPSQEEAQGSRFQQNVHTQESRSQRSRIRSGCRRPGRSYYEARPSYLPPNDPQYSHEQYTRNRRSWGRSRGLFMGQQNLQITTYNQQLQMQTSKDPSKQYHIPQDSSLQGTSSGLEASQVSLETLDQPQKKQYNLNDREIQHWQSYGVDSDQQSVQEASNQETSTMGQHKEVPWTRLQQSETQDQKSQSSLQQQQQCSSSQQYQGKKDQRQRMRYQRDTEDSNIQQIIPANYQARPSYLPPNDPQYSHEQYTKNRRAWGRSRGLFRGQQNLQITTYNQQLQMQTSKDPSKQYHIPRDSSLQGTSSGLEAPQVSLETLDQPQKQKKQYNLDDREIQHWQSYGVDSDQQSVQEASNQETSTMGQHKEVPWTRLQQSETQDQKSQSSLQQQQQCSSSQQYQGKKDQRQRMRYQRDTEDSSMQQQHQIIPDLSKLELQQTQKSDMTNYMKEMYQARIPKRQRIKEYPGKPIKNPIKVLANMFKITFENNFLNKAIHYDVDITIQQPNESSTSSNKFPKALYREIFEKCRSEHFTNRYPAFDGKKNAYSAYDLPFGNTLETDVEIRRCKRCPDNCNEIKHLRVFTITLKKVAEIDLSWMRNSPSNLYEADKYQTGIQVLDIIMRHEPESQHINIGGSFFWQDKLNGRDLSNGLNAACGGFLSVVLGQQLYLNLDVAHKAFVKPQTISNLMKECNNNVVDKLLKGLKVTYNIPGYDQRSYRLNKLGLKANDHKFEHEFKHGKKTVTVTKYFAERYNYQLKYSNLNCAVAVVKGREIYLPPELCTIVSGQAVKKLDKMQTSNMIKEAAMSAPERQKKIKNQVFKKLIKEESNIMSHEFQLSVNDQMEEVNARILDPPNIKYQYTTVNVSKGSWKMEIFKQPVNLRTNEWSILNLCKDEKLKNMHDFMEKLQRNANSVGMLIEKTNRFKSLCSEEIVEIKKYFQENKELKLIIVVIPNSSDAIYSKIKQITELELGVLTQCIKLQNFHEVICNRKNRRESIAKNILLKINTKLNGINHTLDARLKCFEKICMFVGADVTHPSHDDNTPSIAAVTASNDIYGLQYNVIHKILPSKEEIILDFQKIIEVQLSIYKDKTSHLPERIIYYRDGVSEGQLPQVMHHEVEAIKRACVNKGKFDIEITCLVVQKRHHVRLFPKNPEMDSDDRNKNVRAGTIVDSEITHPSHIDFYLVSHASIQGTARPTKYKCIYNESNFTEDEIEELTYYLCHLYARCTRTVSYPVPTYYAHLAAYRGKVLLQGRVDNSEAIERTCRKMSNLPMYFV